ncbi:MAG: glycoside hydrolase family 25 protein [Porcipelethomonas sp.]
MDLKLKRRMALIIASVFAVSFNLSFDAAAADIVPANVNYGRTAYLEYSAESNGYRLTAENGSEIALEYEAAGTDADVPETTEPAVTQPTQSSGTAVTSTASVTSTAAATTAAVRTLSPASTVSDYPGRHRSEALSDWEETMKAYTTTTTTTTTTTKLVTTKAVYNGIDVSRFQGDIDWNKVKADGIDFVIIRAGYGMEYDQVDANFHVNIKGAQAAGIDCGVYWYSYALSTADALREAKVCLSTIKGYTLTYPVAFDIEDTTQQDLSMTQISNITKTFCSYLEENNYYPAVYSYASMLTYKMDSSVLSKYDIWVAHVNVSKPSFDGVYYMWQYSWKGSVNGISTAVDLDYGYRDYPTMIKERKLNGNK